MGVIVIYSLILVVANLGVDILYAIIDPRIQYRPRADLIIAESSGAQQADRHAGPGGMPLVILRSPLAMLCLVYLLALVVLALFPERFAPLGYEQTQLR